MDNNKSQDAVNWFNDFIIALTISFVKTTRRGFYYLFLGLLLARKPDTIYSWVRAANCQQNFQTEYYQLKKAGESQREVQKELVTYTLNQLRSYLSKAKRIFIIGDDTQNNHPGPKIEGTHWMHDSTPQATNSKKCRGLCWVVLTIVIEHPQWGTLSFLLRSKIYLNQKAIDNLPDGKKRILIPKTQMLNILVYSVVKQLRQFGKPITLIVDGGYANQTVLHAMRKRNVSVVTRYRKDAVIYETVEFPRTGKAGRPRKPQKIVYNMEGYSTCECEDCGPWLSVDCSIYGKNRTVEYKSCIARSNISEGEEVRIVMSRWVPDDTRGNHSQDSKPDWIILASTDLSLSPQEVIEIYALRFSIEETFKDLKEVDGMGKPQVRNLESSEGAFTIQMSAHNLVEIWALKQKASYLTEFRSHSDAPSRRPSHADKRHVFRLELAHRELSRIYAPRIKPEIIRELLTTLHVMGI